jgi:membrane protein implicated in regulation of membrane protease activity
MDYSKYTKLTPKKIIVGDGLVEYEGGTWQVRNLAKVSTQKIVIPSELPKPEFKQPQPRQKANLIPAITTILLGFFISASFLLFWIHLPAIVMAMGIVIYSLRKSKRKLDRWQQQRDSHQERLKVWHTINTTPQVVYALSLEPSASPEPLLYSYDRRAVNAAVNAIKDEMNQLSPPATTFKINAITVPEGQTILAVGSEVYEKVVNDLYS